ncbi:NAD(P)H-binding protein [Parvularcula flava]|uniref:NAD(P)H-binding protein n=1 Tax=Aquisalinus luteolus TaxID=1566827 RepID=A0A8J3A0G0_9PROT|nr:NAD(P)H-binding protein [Aquisalinus luteolus]NHK26635.1 NAD(P)H-binding protein [Aquisalinus luteolus]GGH92943.1 NmrA family transcriptional regulator [Aquisalinus luteolus]
MTDFETNSIENRPVLVTGGTGKTGRRIAERLTARGVPVIIGTRSASPAFNWDAPETWAPALRGVGAVYIAYSPDLAVPGATGIIARFVEVAVAAGVSRLVVLSGRGEEEAQACERLVQASGIEWTVVRASWFNQNFSEGEFIDMVQWGLLALPAGQIAEPFVDADDIADVAVAALTEPGHAGRVYEVTGPRLLTFGDVAQELSRAAGRPVRYADIPHEAFIEALTQSGAPEIIVWLMDYLFSTVLDGRNQHLGTGVQEALGREPTDFAAWAARVAASGVWQKAA